MSYFQPITLHVVPPIMVMFAKHPKVNEYDLSSVKTVLCGAAPLSPEIEEAVKRKLSLDYIQQGRFQRLTFLKLLIHVFQFSIVILIIYPQNLNLLFVPLSEVSRIFI